MMHRHLIRASALALAFAIAAPAFADKPEHAGNQGKGHGKENSQKGGPDRSKSSKGGKDDGGVSVSIRFGDRERVAVRDYYGAPGRGCPPGLAKKNNGCMPPGQAKKWAVGRPLPRDVVFYDLPPELVIKLTPPPAGYRYVRAAADILLIAVGTGMVIDAIEDLGRL